MTYDADKIINLVEKARNCTNTDCGEVESNTGESDNGNISDDGCSDLRSERGNMGT
jgi:hypothetical protein